MSRFYARSASDKTDRWPLWFVADSYQGGLNVTAGLVEARDGYTRLQAARFRGVYRGAFGFLPFLNPLDAARLSAWSNANIGGRPMAMWMQAPALTMGPPTAEGGR